MVSTVIPTPDFETYSWQYPLVTASKTANYVTVTWSDGRGKPLSSYLVA